MKNVIYLLFSALSMVGCKQRSSQVDLNNDSIKGIDRENSLTEVVPS